MRERKLCTYCGKNDAICKGLCHNCYVRYKRNGFVEYITQDTRRYRGPSEKSKAVLAAYNPSMTYEELAKQFGITRQRAYQIVAKYRKKTNGDRIRKMSDEKLAEKMLEIMRGWCPKPTSECTSGCKECLLKWVRSEAG